MKKHIRLTFLVILLVIGSLVVYEFYQVKHNTSLLVKNIQLQLTKHDIGQFTKVTVHIIGEIPKGSTKLTIFADNRYLEFSPKSFQEENGITYEGQKAGGADTIFSLTPDFDGDLTISYLRKGEIYNPPLIYAYIESQIDSFLFRDTKVWSKIFELKG
ncbi:hypothetical protein QO009_004171 [Brevibacillus aydinogluensis]|uniref:Uncharacterized protein n=1 Tax=Brevibacillus aydinogluensis TaxID=927786 RepID=A0AA48M6A4_9BACL|nr:MULTISPECIES: hypothetical protein [Brevibacillus]MBR8661489.1 hypothetical protein [Brevibacillus sp. NL20B1]MDT3418237.1 hypothetical protein [Brevibacillus aydinogluensis]CAJ1001087.1 hypothetical protein BSPP4475_01945 [Brevibacillus aydinogluensis]